MKSYPFQQGKKKVMFQKPEKFLMMAGLVLLDKLTYLKSVKMLGETFFKNFKSTEELTRMIIRKYKTKINWKMRA